MAIFLCVVMLITAVPLSGFAYGSPVQGYNGAAAAIYAKTYWSSYNSGLWGNYNPYGGDCAAFISQCLYAGGIPMTSSWHWHHLSKQRTNTWTVANDLKNYLISIGGREITNPSASDISVGDVIFYDWDNNGSVNHTAICTDIINGVPYIACHYNDRYTSNWRLGVSTSQGYKIHLIKLYGSTCDETSNLKSYDVYRANTGVSVRTSASTSASKVNTIQSTCTVHIFNTTTVNGVKWGYTNYKGSWGWVCLSYMSYVAHVDAPQLDHTFGEWYTVKQATCTTDGLMRRVCSRCGKVEEKTVSKGGHVPGAAATCTTAQVCTACGTTLVPALGHYMGDWETVTEPTCISDGLARKDCSRCNYYETKVLEKSGHDYIAEVAAATCTGEGYITYTCSVCGDSYSEKATDDWSSYVTTYRDDIDAEYIKSRTEYRYRTKSYTTGSYSTLSGWTLYNTTSAWGSYGSWSAWQDTAVSSSSSREVQTQTLTTYKYYHYSLTKQNGSVSTVPIDMSAYNVVASFNGYSPAVSQTRHEIALTSQLTASGTYTDASSNTYTEYTGYSCCNTTSGVDDWFYMGTGSKTQYRYRDRSLVYTYYFYKWSDWSDWSTTAVSATSDKEVQTRTTYSYKLTALGHNFKATEVIAPTCLTEGYTLYTCTRCGATYKDNYTDALGHDMGEWYTVSEPSGEVKGVERRDCQRCDYYETREYGDVVHSYTATVIEPTCTEQGYTIFSCTTCDDEYIGNYTDPLGHDFGTTFQEKAPTCTEDGENIIICDRCGYETTEAVPAIGHNYVVTEKVEATCTEDGYSFYVCTNCKDSYIGDEVEAHGHSLGEWYTAEEAVCQGDGTARRDCEYCDYYETKPISALPHTYVATTVEPTCCFNGYTEYVCSRCGDRYTADWVDALGHDLGEWEVVTEPTCTEEGLMIAPCSRCDYSEEETIDPLGHSFAEEVIESTCVEGGLTVHTCTVCGYSYTDGETGELGHDMGEWYTVKEATCTSAGEIRRDCSRCGYYEIDYTDITDHDYSSVTIDPTCTEQGYDRNTCSVCGQYYDDNYTAALGHDLGEWYTVTEATYTENGLEQRDCSRCDYYEQQETDMLPRQSFTATFIADGEIVAQVEFPRDATSIDEPAVPEKARYTGEWESYTLTNEDITIYAQYRLTAASDEGLSYIDTEKTADYDTESGVATITLKASSAAKTIISTSSETVPLDIVLVVDQSGSMADKLGGSTTKLEALQSAATDFIETVYENAKATGADHKIAIVGFSVNEKISNDYPRYLNTDILTTTTSSKINYGSATNETYASALMTVNNNGVLNSDITDAVGYIQAKGSTAAELGLDMAKRIYAQNPVEGTNRRRIVVFMTDGEPNHYSGFDTTVANSAISLAYDLKNTYDAEVYSVGVTSSADANAQIKSNSTQDINKFLHFVSSNYETATCMTSSIAAGGNNGYYLSVNDTSALSDVFVDIVIDSVTNTTDFTDVTLVDTVSKYFTMTDAQEAAFRASVIRLYGITNDAITVTRNSDGTTTVMVEGIEPYETTDADGNTVFEAMISFDVSADEDALNKGKYNTNTEDAGVILGQSEVYEAVFKTPYITVPENRNIAVFTVNGSIYSIVNAETGETVEIPEYTVPAGCDFSGWEMAEDYVMLGRYAEFEATLTASPYTVTWNIGDETVVETYNAGELITVPQVETTAEKTFAGWDSEVPSVMPESSLEFTAVFEEHVHSYTSAVTENGGCINDSTVTYTCETCGDTYTETIAGTGSHDYVAQLTSSTDTEARTVVFTCSRCGEQYELELVFYVESTDGEYVKTYNMSLLDSANIEQQPDGSVTIKIPLDSHQLKNGCTLSVYHVEESGELTKVPSETKDGMLIFTASQFSNYTVIDRTCAESNGGYVKLRKVVYKLVRIFATFLRLFGAIDTDEYENMLAKYSFGWVMTNIYYYDYFE
ncbi:MAG: amidase domain-containing protein [Clostridiales bacterium]|nr:amidase domain-containing protein [Clostridiales bacterium]